jgi:O26-antigen biosynthesis N-acetyl-L-fucosamine transferase
MRILLLVDCYAPYAKSSAVQMRDLALALRDSGHEIVVLTPSDQISGNTELERKDGVTVFRVKSRKIKGAWRVFRAVGESGLSRLVWRRSRRFLRESPPDGVVFYSPTIFWGSLVARLKAHFKCETYLILRDIFPAWGVDAGVLRKGLVYAYFRKKEAEQYRVADRIAVQSPGNLRYFEEEFPSLMRRTEVLYNWMDVRDQPLRRTNYRAQLGLQGKVVFVYGGNLGVAQDVDNLVRLSRRLSDRQDIRLVLVGEGSEASRLSKIIRSEKIHNIDLLPAVSQEEYLAMLSEFDVGLLSLDRRLKTHNVPGKLLGYMYWGKPILASINLGNDLFGLLGEARAGFCLRNGDDNGFAKAAVTLADDANLRDQMGANSRKLLERIFSSQAAAQQIIQHFQPRTVDIRDGATVKSEISIAGREGFRTEY